MTAHQRHPEPGLTVAPEDGQSWPITAEQIAERWHCGVRKVKRLAKANGIGRRSSRTLLFNRDEYEQLYESLPQCRSVSSSAKGRKTSTSGALSEARLSLKVRALLTGNKPNSSARSGKRNYMKPRSSARVLSFPSSERS